MDKLTRTGQDFENEFCSGCDCVYYGEPNGCNHPDGNCGSYTYFTLVADRLAEYEDTGLSPAEVAELAQAYRWIPIDERMPDSCGLKVLLTATNAFNQISVFSGFTGYMEHGKMEFHSNERDKDISKWHVTHWMPLPEPPISRKSVEGV